MHTVMPRLEGALPFLQQDKKGGYRLYVLSNASDEFYIYFPKSYDVNLFEGIVVSADLHIIKPDERIYRYLLERYGLNPGETLFIDDRLENVEGASEIRSVGQAVKTPPYHGGNRGSMLLQTVTEEVCSSGKA